MDWEEKCEAARTWLISLEIESPAYPASVISDRKEITKGRKSNWRKAMKKWRLRDNVLEYQWHGEWKNALFGPPNCMVRTNNPKPLEITHRYKLKDLVWAVKNNERKPAQRHKYNTP